MLDWADAFYTLDEIAVYGATRWDRRNRAGLIESATPCHDAQVVRPYRGSNPLYLTVLTSKSEDYATAPQLLQYLLYVCIPFASTKKNSKYYCCTDEKAAQSQ